MNGEGYGNPTADEALKHADRTPEPVMKVVHMLRELEKCNDDSVQQKLLL